MVLAVSETDVTRRSIREFRIASLGIQAASSLAKDAARISRWRYGRIVTEGGRLSRIEGRWWPYQGNILQTMVDIRLRPLQQDRCELYYGLPLGSPGFLTLNYVRSGSHTSLTTFYAATLVLDQIAKLKQSNAIVCHATNPKISARLFARWGWHEHCLDWPGRHFIKRFYGQYPELSPYWRARLQM